MKTARQFFLGVFFALLATASLLSAGVQYPGGDLLLAPDGSFYGTSAEGGTQASGTVFRVTPDSEVTVLVNFTGNSGLFKGAQPRAGLVRDGSGALWGTTEQGGASGKGTVFKIVLAGGQAAFSTVVEFDGTNGANPVSSLVIDANGLLWGTTVRGGANDLGTLFSLDPVSTTVTTVSFTGTAGAVIGSAPKGALFRDAAGVFWGTASAGGALNLGTIFKYDPSTTTFESVKEFTGTSGNVLGAASAAALVDGGSGVLWGTTQQGGTSDLGTVFKIDTGTSTFTTVANFAGANGQNPRGRLLPNGGFFYGTASGGGAFNQGTVFQVDATTGVLTTVVHLTGTNGVAKGTAPLGGLTFDNLGSLWTTASQGGREDLGAIFRINAGTGAYILLAEPNPVPTLPAATAKPPAKNTTTGPVGATVTITGTAKDIVELLQVLVSINDGPFERATLIPPSKAGQPYTWSIEVVPENGVNVVVVKSIDNGGDASKPVTITFNYTVVRPELTGAYNGLSVPEPTSPAPSEHVGVFNLKALPNGRFTGKFKLGLSAKSTTLTGSFGNDGTVRFGKKGTLVLPILRKNQSTLLLELALDVSAPLTRQITGTLSDNGIVVATLLGDQAIYTSKKNPVLPLVNVPPELRNAATDKGSYTAVLRALTPAAQGLPATEFPQGDGYATGTISTAGVAKFSGKLAEGTSFTFSNALSQNNTAPFFAKLSGGGVVAGFVTFQDLPGSDAAGTLHWYKSPKVKGASYRNGWLDGIEVNFAASKFVAPKISGNTLLGNAPGTDNALLAITTPTATVTNNLTINLSGPVFVGGANPPKVSLTSKGLFKGSFFESSSGKNLTFNGALLQKAGEGAGYFLLPPPGAPAADPKESALVEIIAQP